ncbi:hypothetical protein BQ8482_330189 [Mesorhizobium delmotii]|uniref:Uncharacterized protein n=1 Tax=Mesorhizobium delmotii TaxID=1631247 RepID=A0A2P9APG9_9HYPH|nr:hypothetical protein BQ8482_330189 [Mesorhizobium delmotii]
MDYTTGQVIQRKQQLDDRCVNSVSGTEWGRCSRRGSSLRGQSFYAAGYVLLTSFSMAT